MADQAAGGRDAGEGQAQQRAAARTRGAVAAAASAVLARGSSAMATLVSLPLVVGYLGQERYGIWVTVASMASWLALLDLGLGLGLKNGVAAASGRDDPEAIGGAISAASAFTLALIIPGIGAVWAVVPLMKWEALLNAQGGMDPRELELVVATSATLVLLSMWTNLGYAIVQALQQGYRANVFTSAAALVSLALMVWAAQVRAPLPVLALSIMGPGVVAPGLLWLRQAWRDPVLRPRLRFQLGHARSLLETGAGFFLLQLAVLVVFQMDAFVVARFRGPAEVTPLAIATRVLALGTLALSSYLAALWPAYAEAAAREDWPWIRRTHARMRWVMVGGAGAVGIVYVAAGPWLVPLWAGEAARGSVLLYAWIALAATLRAWTDAHAILLNGLSRVRPQVYSALIHALLTLGLSILFARRWGAVGVAAAGALGYALVSAWWLPVAVRWSLQQRTVPLAGAGSQGAVPATTGNTRRGTDRLSRQGQP